MKRYQCIGGPLDGMRVTAADLRPRIVSYGPTSWNPTASPAGTVLREGGVYGDQGRKYADYNRSTGGGPTMVRLHKSLFKEVGE